jgi:hypothetical protein
MYFLFGLAFVVFILGFQSKRHSIYWNHLEGPYGRTWKKHANERWGHAVLFGEVPIFKSYNGTLKIGVESDGISLRTMFPLDALFCQPLFIPFTDIVGWDGVWYVNSKTIHLELKRAPSIKIAMPRDQVEWIRNNSGMKLPVITDKPIHRARPAVWYFILISALVLPISVLVIVYLSFAQGLI